MLSGGSGGLSRKQRIFARSRAVRLPKFSLDIAACWAPHLLLMAHDKTFLASSERFKTSLTVQYRNRADKKTSPWSGIKLSIPPEIAEAFELGDKTPVILIAIGEGDDAVLVVRRMDPEKVLRAGMGSIVSNLHRVMPEIRGGRKRKAGDPGALLPLETSPLETSPLETSTEAA